MCSTWLKSRIPSYLRSTKVNINSISVVFLRCDRLVSKADICFLGSHDVHRAFEGNFPCSMSCFRSLVVMTNAFQALDPSSNLGGCITFLLGCITFCSRASGAMPVNQFLMESPMKKEGTSAGLRCLKAFEDNTYLVPSYYNY